MSEVSGWRGGRWYRLPNSTRCEEIAAAVSTGAATGEREARYAGGRGGGGGHR